MLVPLLCLSGVFYLVDEEKDSRGREREELLMDWLTDPPPPPSPQATLCISCGLTFGLPQRDNIYWRQRAGENKVLPYISDTGADRPENIVFGIGLSLAAALFAATFWAVWAHLRALFRRVYGASPPPRCYRLCCAMSLDRLNDVAFYVGAPSCVFLLLLACVSETVQDSAHSIFAFVFFAAAYFHFVVHAGPHREKGARVWAPSLPRHPACVGLTDGGHFYIGLMPPSFSAPQASPSWSSAARPTAS